VLETLGEYGLNRLESEGTEAQARNRHLAYYSAMVQTIEPNLHGGHREASADRVEREIDNLAIYLGELERAQVLFEESSAILTRIRYMLAMPWPIRRLSYIARLRGDPRRAVKLSIESLHINLEVDERQSVAASLVALTQVAKTEGRPELGVQLLGPADAVVGPSGPQLLPFDRIQHEAITQRLGGVVDGTTWNAAWATARLQSLDEAVQAALTLAD
jgi:hypothetical protein